MQPTRYGTRAVETAFNSVVESVRYGSGSDRIQGTSLLKFRTIVEGGREVTNPLSVHAVATALVLYRVLEIAEGALSNGITWLRCLDAVATAPVL